MQELACSLETRSYEYKKRCFILVQEYSDIMNLSDGISMSYGWLSTFDNMLSNDSR